MPEQTTPTPTPEERAWRKKGLKERLRILESRTGVPSFIDKATIDERIAWIKKELAERQANKTGRTPGNASSPGPTLPCCVDARRPEAARGYWHPKCRSDATKPCSLMTCVV